RRTGPRAGAAPSRRGRCSGRALFSASSPAYTIGMALKDGMLAEFDHEIATTRKLLERLPDDRLSWKPHEKSMSLGGLGTHLGGILSWSGAILNETSFDLAGAPPPQQEKSSRAEVLAAFDENAKRARASM